MFHQPGGLLVFSPGPPAPGSSKPEGFHRPADATFLREGKMNIDDMTIAAARKAVEDGKAIEAALGNKPAATAPAGNGAEQHGLQIVILDRGWVFVGDVTTDANWVRIANAKCVRVWGTTKGIGELAANGPLSATKLDDAGAVRAPLAALKGLIACEAASWTK